MNQGIATEVEAQDKHQLVYTGKLGELFRIFAENIALTIITLGIYRFWAKVRMRQYLWANTLYYDEPFRYTGNGSELFIGFLKVLLCVFLPGVSLLQIMNFLTASVVAGLGLVTLMSIFSPCVVFWVRRYRLSRSSWRGIKFQQTGSVWPYARKALIGAFLNTVTLFLYVPWNAVNLLDYQINRIRFGTMYFSYQGKVQDIRKEYGKIWRLPLLIFLCGLGLAVLFSIVISIWQAKFGTTPITITSAKDFMASTNKLAMFAILGVVLFLTWLPMLAIVFAKIRFKLLILNHIANNTRLDNLQFQFTATFWQLFRLTTGNFFIRLLSLGLLSPIAIHRQMKFLSKHLSMRGLPAFPGIAQVPSDGQSGEGWVQWFDIDALDF